MCYVKIIISSQTVIKTCIEEMQGSLWKKVTIKSLKQVQVKSHIGMLLIKLSEILWNIIELHQNLLRDISSDAEHEVLTSLFSSLEHAKDLEQWSL